MISLDSPTQSRDAVLDIIYRIQADLQILMDTLARERALEISTRAALNLACLQAHLQQSMPSLNRH